MKVRVEDQERSYTIPLPTRLLFSSGSAWLIQHTGLKFLGNDTKELPPEAMKVLFAELRRIKKQYGDWELVEVHSASGQRVTVSL